MAQVQIIQKRSLLRGVLVLHQIDVVDIIQHLIVCVVAVHDIDAHKPQDDRTYDRHGT